MSRVSASIHRKTTLWSLKILQLIEQAGSAGVPVRFENRDEITRLAQTDKHQGCLLIGRESQPVTSLQQCLQSIGPDTLLLLLDGVQDPRNFGACLRTANAAGVDLVVVGRNRNVGLTPVVSKVAAGAAEIQPVAAVANLARFMAFLRDSGTFIIGADDAAPAELHMADLRGPLAMVMGAEGEGLRRLTRERCDLLVRIPMRGSVESLNVAVAAGVCLYEALRQRS